MKGLMIIIMILTVILLGIVSFLWIDSEVENPFTTFSTFGNSLTEKSSPANWIKENQILIYDDRIVILVANATLSRYSDTNSMDPNIDFNANGIEIKPGSPSQIHVGDIISFEQGGELIVHRVIKIGMDEQGWFCVTKGDNALQDDGKIRFTQINSITIAIIY